jgi:aquaporin TIP
VLQSLPEYALAGGVTGWHAAVLEAAMAFGLMYAYYATSSLEPRRRARAVAPLAVGLLAGANVLACGALDGAVMNPARAFGPAVVGSRRWSNHWVYWAGPMAGAGLFGFLYEHLALSPSPPDDDKEPAAAAPPNRGSSRRA